MHAGRCKRGKPYIDSQVWPRNQESMHRWGSGVLQAEPFSFVATKIRIVCGRSLPRRLLQAGHSFLRQRRIESDAEGRCREPLQAEPFSFAATKNRIGRGSSLPRRALQAGHSSLLRRWCCSDSQIHPIKSRITAVQDAFPGKKLHRFASLAPKSRIEVHFGQFPGKTLHRFASLGMKSRIDAAFGLFPGKTLHRFSNLGLNLRIDARKRA